MPEWRHSRLRIRALALAAALTGTLLGAPLAAAPAHAATLATGQQLAVPAYIYPSGTGATQWAQVASAGSKVGMAIANVYNGPSNGVDSNWATAIHNAHAAGVKVYGYVDTGYFGTTGRLTRLRDTSVPAWLAQVETDVNAWYQFYGTDIDGIFFDDATNVCGPTSTSTTYSSLYKQISDYVKQRHSGALTVDNPGVDVPQCYETSADVLLTFEGSYASYTSYAPSSWEAGYDPHKFMNLIYATGSTQMADAITRSKNNGVGYVYVTDGVLSNPWNALPSYWSSELTSLAVTSTGTPATPAKPTAAAVTGTTVDVSWTSASWPAVVGYDVYRNGVQVGEVTNYTPSATDYTVDGLSPSTSYSFTVKARDYAGDVSAASTALTVSTSAAGATAPTTPTGLTASNLQANSVALTWGASTAGSKPLAFYNVYQNGTWILSLPSTQTSARFDGLTPGTAYTYTVLAQDTSGHSSALSSGITVTAPVPASDISAAASTLTSTTATYTATYNLEYNSHIVCIDSDNVGTTGYELTFSTGNVGCDYMIEDDSLYRYAGSGTDWSWTPLADDPQETVSGYTYSWTLQASWLGTHATTEKVVFNGSGYSADAWGSVVTVTQQ